MNSKQLGILNALVTFAAEHAPGGLSRDEQEVARIVGIATLCDQDAELQPPRRYEYKRINCSHHGSVENAANDWSKGGWRVVAALPGNPAHGKADTLIIERPLPEEPIVAYQIDGLNYSPDEVTVVRRGT